MAENTRMKDLYETLKSHEQNFVNTGERMSKMENGLNELEQTLASINQIMEYVLRKSNEAGSGSNGGNVDRAEGSGNIKTRQETYTPPHIRNQGNHSNSNPTAYKVEFPEFNGENPQGWIRKANRFFQLNPNDNMNKILHAGYYMNDVADTWYMEYIEGWAEIDWEMFCEMLLQRFLSPGGEDIVIEFTRLNQMQDVASYWEKFDELKSLVKIENPNLTEEFLVSCFLRGLKEELRMPVHLFKPVNLAKTMNASKMLESMLEVWGWKNKLQAKPSTNKQSYTSTNGGKNNETNMVPYRRIHDPEYQRRRALGLCFHCNDKYVPGHVYSKKMFNLILVEDSEEADDEEWEEENEDQGTISIHAVIGNQGPNTIQILGNMGKKRLNILIDSGSTHSFQVSRTTEELNCLIEETRACIITMVDEGKTTCQYKCAHFTWQMQGYTFTTDMKVIQLGSCDMILGADWMYKHNPITFDFKKNNIRLNKDGMKINLEGIRALKEIWALSAKAAQRFMNKTSQGILTHIFTINVEGKQEETDPEITKILEEFRSVFEEPRGMPPKRRIEHEIHLKPCTTPIFQRAYRYSYSLKNEIEKLVKEMLEQEIIQSSTSPFTSLSLLVRKKDSSWRFCVDYRKLNEQTVKNKYPMPVIEDLLTGLHGSKIYSKIDLRQGYLFPFAFLLEFVKGVPVS